MFRRDMLASYMVLLYRDLRTQIMIFWPIIWCYFISKHTMICWPIFMALLYKHTYHDMLTYMALLYKHTYHDMLAYMKLLYKHTYLIHILPCLHVVSLLKALFQMRLFCRCWLLLFELPIVVQWNLSYPCGPYSHLTKEEWSSGFPWCSFPVNTKHLYSIYTMLDQRRRRWADIV